MSKGAPRVVIPMLHFFPDHPSGSARLAFEEAGFLARQGYEVWAVAQDLTRRRPEHRTQDGLEILSYPAPGFGPWDPRRSRWHQERTRDLLRRYIPAPPALIHGHSLLHYDGARSFVGRDARRGYYVHSPAALEMRARARGGPLVERLRAPLAARLTREIEERCLKDSEVVTANSEYTRAQLGRLHGAWAYEKTQVIPGWVDLDRFRIATNRGEIKARLGWPKDVPVLFTLRRLVPRTGIDLLLRALKEVSSTAPRCHLVIAGDGPLRTTLEALARTLGLAERVRFTGLVHEEALPAMYAAADAFVLPSAELECFGLIALEALACGRPVLATPVGAIPEVLARFETAWLAREASPRGLAGLLRDYLSGALPGHDPGSLREKVARTYSREVVLPRLVAHVLGTPIENFKPAARAANAAS